MRSEPKVKRALPLLNGAGQRLAFGGSFEDVPRYEDWPGYTAAMTKRATMEVKARMTQMLDVIQCGDAKELARAIPDASVDLIFTDPVYQNVDDYRWLAETALRILAPKGKLLVWCSKPKMARCQIAMEDTGLEYVYTLDYTVVAKTFRMRWYNLFCWTTPCLWFQRDGSASRPRKWIPDNYTDTILLDDGESVEMRAAFGDTFISTAGPSGSYVWNKNLGVLTAWIDAFSSPGAIVYDPFTGSGSIPVVCRALGRRFIASEIQPDVATRAQDRLATTPMPLESAIEPMQSLLEDAAERGTRRQADALRSAQGPQPQPNHRRAARGGR